MAIYLMAIYLMAILSKVANISPHPMRGFCAAEPGYASQES